MRRQATPLIMKGFPVTFTLTVMRWQATALIMKDIPVTFTLKVTRGGGSQKTSIFSFPVSPLR